MFFVMSDVLPLVTILRLRGVAATRGAGHSFALLDALLLPGLAWKPGMVADLRGSGREILVCFGD